MVCDADYTFLCVNIGASGRASDSGIFKNSVTGPKLANEEMNFPEPVEHIADGNL